MKRIVNYHEKNGVFNIQCDVCPLNVGDRKNDCLAGMGTTIQGHVPIHTCKHYAKDSFAHDHEKGLLVECGKEAPKVKRLEDYPTPKTDAAMHYAIWDKGMNNGNVAPLDFARDLERKVEWLKDYIRGMMAAADEFGHTAQVEEFRKVIESV